jgi:hypothetical protein
MNDEWVFEIDFHQVGEGEKIEHINNAYNTNTAASIINIHIKNNHCFGLRRVVNSLTVKEMWLQEHF